MKAYFLIVTIASLFSCKQKEVTNDERKFNEFHKSLSDLELAGLANNKSIDTIMLGYMFGMDAYEVKKNTLALYKKGKLKKDYYGYFLPIDSKLGSTFKGYIEDVYFSDKLCEIRLEFKLEDEPALVMHRLLEIYNENYGNYNLFEKPFDDMSIYRGYWIKNNLKIIAEKNLASSYVKYIDLRFEKQKIYEDSVHDAAKAAKSTEGL